MHKFHMVAVFRLNKLTSDWELRAAPNILYPTTIEAESEAASIAKAQVGDRAVILSAEGYFSLPMPDYTQLLPKIGTR